MYYIAKHMYPMYYTFQHKILHKFLRGTVVAVIAW